MSNAMFTARRWASKSWSAEGRKNWCGGAAMRIYTRVAFIRNDVTIAYMTQFVRYFRRKAKIKTRR